MDMVKFIDDSLAKLSPKIDKVLIHSQACLYLVKTFPNDEVIRKQTDIVFAELKNIQYYQKKLLEQRELFLKQQQDITLN